MTDKQIIEYLLDGCFDANHPDACEGAHGCKGDGGPYDVHCGYDFDSCCIFDGRLEDYKQIINKEDAE